jgi:tetratricopeptide (TPR) repeat protein
MESLPREPRGDDYWEVQTLRMKAGRSASEAGAWRDLGLLYLRAGQTDRAEAAFLRGASLAPSDPELWLYLGLSRESLGRREEALTTYRQAPSLTAASPYGRAMAGRMASLEEEEWQRRLDTARDDGMPEPPEPPGPGTFGVVVLGCDGRAEEADLGRGLSEMLSRNLDQLPANDGVDPGRVRSAFDRTAGMSDRPLVERLAWVARVLALETVVGGTCTFDQDGTLAVTLQLHRSAEKPPAPVSAAGEAVRLPEIERDLMAGLIDELRIWLPDRARRSPLTGIGLEALRAFSRGRAFEEAGEFDASAAAYEQAQALAPAFVPAATRLDLVRQRQTTSLSDPGDLIALLDRLSLEMPVRQLLGARLRLLDGALPGRAARELPPGTLGELPAPPLPARN